MLKYSVMTQTSYNSTIKSGIWHCPDTGEYCFSRNSMRCSRTIRNTIKNWVRVQGGSGDYIARKKVEEAQKNGVHIISYSECKDCIFKVSTDNPDYKDIKIDHIEYYDGDHSFEDPIRFTAKKAYLCKKCGFGTGFEDVHQKHLDKSGHTGTTVSSITTKIH
jgi:hypothetical protein